MGTPALRLRAFGKERRSKLLAVFELRGMSTEDAGKMADRTALERKHGTDRGPRTVRRIVGLRHVKPSAVPISYFQPPASSSLQHSFRNHLLQQQQHVSLMVDNEHELVAPADMMWTRCVYAGKRKMESGLEAPRERPQRLIEI